jgi:hypothetical protein
MISTAQSQGLKKDLQRQTEAVKNYQQEVSAAPYYLVCSLSVPLE